MPFDLPLRCRCGRLRGRVAGASPSIGFRFVCHCRDCQAFARLLDRTDGLAGGTPLVQMPSGCVAFTAGTETLRCLKLSDRVLRWYADCCRTPIANTAAGPRVPVVGIFEAVMHRGAGPPSLDDIFGPPLCRIYAGSATGPLPADPPDASPGLRLRRAATILAWWARGRGRPTPFFDHRTKAPLAVPRVVTARERAGL